MPIDSNASGRVREIRPSTPEAVLEYSPDLDGMADPGEVVWSWVPFEEEPDQGKDRPLLVVGRNGRRLLAMMLSSRDHSGRDDWLHLGAGPWDREGRPSFLCLDRVFELDEDDIRREGAIMDPQRFAEVAASLMRLYGWGASKPR